MQIWVYFCYPGPSGRLSVTIYFPKLSFYHINQKTELLEFDIMFIYKKVSKFSASPVGRTIG